jgi:signal transduction histidine kinase
MDLPPAVDKAPPIDLLIVDDDDALRGSLGRFFTGRGIAPRLADGGAEALEAQAVRAADVVVLDMRMPGLDGLDVLRRLKASAPDTEVIMLTGHANAADGVAGIKAGAFDYLAKPVELEHLLGKVRQAAERKRLEAERRRQQALRAEMEKRLAQSQRLAALGTMVMGVGHEINNPLAIIHEAAGWLRMQLDLGRITGEEPRREVARSLEKIEAGVERIRRITRQLLESHSPNDVVAREVDPRELAREMAAAFQPRADELGVALELISGAPVPALWTDPFKLRQVLINLVANALEAAGGGGRVELGLEPEGEGVAFVVRDNGPGVPAEHLERVFEPFFTTKETGKGSGLGLFVSQRLMERLGGRLTLTSRYGQGAAFRAWLPLVPEGG